MTHSIDQALFQQLSFVRSLTIRTVQAIDPEKYNLIPNGYRNHIHWQIAHLHFVLERFVFHLALNDYQEHDMDMPLFGNGSAPDMWTTCGAVYVNTPQEWIQKLTDQPARIEVALNGKLDQPLSESLTTATGLTMNTPRELITYAIFHEGMHLMQIRMYAKMVTPRS